MSTCTLDEMTKAGETGPRVDYLWALHWAARRRAAAFVKENGWWAISKNDRTTDTGDDAPPSFTCARASDDLNVGDQFVFASINEAEDKVDVNTVLPLGDDGVLRWIYLTGHISRAEDQDLVTICRCVQAGYALKVANETKQDLAKAEDYYLYAIQDLQAISSANNK